MVDILYLAFASSVAIILGITKSDSLIHYSILLSHELEAHSTYKFSLRYESVGFIKDPWTPRCREKADMDRNAIFNHYYFVTSNKSDPMRLLGECGVGSGSLLRGDVVYRFQGMSEGFAIRARTLAGGKKEITFISMLVFLKSIRVNIPLRMLEVQIIASIPKSLREQRGSILIGWRRLARYVCCSSIEQLTKPKP